MSKHHTELKGGIARVTINKPDKLNTMTLHTVDDPAMVKAFGVVMLMTLVGVTGPS